MVSNSPKKRAIAFWFENNLESISRYIAVGILASTVYLIFPMLAIASGMSKHHAILLGLTMATIISYLSHLHYTFKVQNNVGILIKYLAVLAFNYLLFSWLVDMISKRHENTYLQILFAGGLSIGVSFILNSLLVFRKMNFSDSMEE